MFLELQKSGRKLDLGLQEILGIEVISGGVARVLLNVQADGGTRRAGTRETNNDAATRREASVQALVGRDGTIQVGVGEVASLGDGTACACY